MNEAERRELKRVLKAKKAAWESAAFERGRADARAEFDALLQRFHRLKELNGSGDVFKAHFDESKHKRNHGQFSSTGGTDGDARPAGDVRRGGDGAGADDPGSPGGDVPAAPPHAEETATPETATPELVPTRPDSSRLVPGEPATPHESELLALTDDVPPSLLRRVGNWIAGRYAGLAEKYGHKGAVAILAATVAMVPVPLPGTVMIPVAIADAVQRLKHRLAGVSKSHAPELDEAGVRAEALELLRELYAAEGEEVGEESDAGPDPHDALLEAMLAVREELDGGPDLPAALAWLRGQIPAGTVGKAWSEGSHPRDDAGRFVSSQEIRTAARSPGHAEELRASVTDPGERAKLDSAIAGAVVPGLKQGRANTGAATPQYHQEEGYEHAGLLRGELVKAVKKGDKAAVGAWFERARKMSAVHWREARDKALAQFRADYPDHPKLPQALESVGRAFRNAEEKAHDAYAEWGAAATAKIDGITDDLQDFEDGFAEAQHAYTWGQDHAWGVIEYHRNELGGKEKGYKLGRYFKAVVGKAWDESLHPRGKGGHFIAKDRLQAAKSDPKVAAQLREEVKPEDAHKLEAVISGEKDPGRTKRGQARHEAAGRKQGREESRKRADDLIRRIHAGVHAEGGVTADDLSALAAHLPEMRLADVRRARLALHANKLAAGFGGARRKAEMVESLVAQAKNHALSLRLEGATHGPGGEALTNNVSAPPDRPEPTLEELETGVRPAGGNRRALHNDPLSRPYPGGGTPEAPPVPGNLVAGEPGGNSPPIPPTPVDKPSYSENSLSTPLDSRSVAGNTTPVEPPESGGGAKGGGTVHPNATIKAKEELGTPGRLPDGVTVEQLHKQHAVLAEVIRASGLPLADQTALAEGSRVWATDPRGAQVQIDPHRGAVLVRSGATGKKLLAAYSPDEVAALQAAVDAANARLTRVGVSLTGGERRAWRGSGYNPDVESIDWDKYTGGGAA